MPIIGGQQKVLPAIKTSVQSRLYRDDAQLEPVEITNQWRRNVLQDLLAFSADIPRPGDKIGIHAQADHTYSPTLNRWQILAYIAGVDLTVAKWFESHLDALAILHEIGAGKASDGLWAVWAAEGLALEFANGHLNGAKGWCSGANIVDYGLITYRDEQDNSQLLTVAMQQDGIEIDNSVWQAVGMQPTDTATIRFENVSANEVGAPNAYLDRVGFWHGAAGVAACWYGATAKLASYLLTSQQRKPNDFKAMYLGEISAALAINRQYFAHVARLIDRQPSHNHELAIRQLRVSVEQLARLVQDNVGQALGAAPFCANAHFARLSADLTVFIRQAHAAFDLKTIGEQTSQRAEESSQTWQL